ncbi:MAG: 5-formyltetrahydrofolate cyclo-ligase [Candidatus Binatia bacterium]
MAVDLDREKARIRQALLAARRVLPAASVARLSEAICARIVTAPEFAHAERVVGYAPIGREVDPTAALRVALRRGKVVYLPHSVGGSGVVFRRAGDTAAVGPGGEPLGEDAAAVLFLVPGVAFDRAGGRLGRGAGAYDRALACHPGAWRFGVGYELQIVSSVPTARWDVRMHGVVTEARILYAADESRGVVAEKEDQP